MTKLRQVSESIFAARNLMYRRQVDIIPQKSLNDKLSSFLTEVSFDTSEENQLSYFQNGYFDKIL